ncbi:MAG: hypothetical protein ACI4VF_09895 [Lachnospirales bacterium]
MDKLFRKEAVDSYKEQFSVDRQITKTSISTFLCIFLCVLGLLFAIVWFVFGKVLNTVNVDGVIYPPYGIENITSSKAGMISDITVETGEDIKVGDVVAIVPDEEILEKINNAVNSNADKNTIEKLKEDYYFSSVIVSKTNGTVLTVSKEGDYVEKGSVIITVAGRQSVDNERQIMAFLPTSQKNNISKGCAVQISPNYAPREKFGYINGYVADIGNLIITKSNAKKYLDVYNIPNLIDENETYIVVYINLLSDEKTSSGLSWSQKSSGNINVETGTLCNSSIVVSETSPAKWILGGGS